MTSSPTYSAHEQKFLEQLQAGMALTFQRSENESPEMRAERTITALLIDRIVNEPKRTVSLPIKISNAIIDGPLNLQYVTFEAEVSIVNCEFTGDIDFSFSTFEHSANFNGSTAFHVQTCLLSKGDRSKSTFIPPDITSCVPSSSGTAAQFLSARPYSTSSSFS